MSHLTFFQFLSKSDWSGSIVCPQATVFPNSPNWPFLGIFYELFVYSKRSRSSLRSQILNETFSMIFNHHASPADLELRNPILSFCIFGNCKENDFLFHLTCNAFLRAVARSSYYCARWQQHSVWKSPKKSHSTFTFWVDSSLKMPKMIHFGEVLKNWSFR